MYVHTMYLLLTNFCFLNWNARYLAFHVLKQKWFLFNHDAKFGSAKNAATRTWKWYAPICLQVIQHNVHRLWASVSCTTDHLPCGRTVAVLIDYKPTSVSLTETWFMRNKMLSKNILQWIYHSKQYYISTLKLKIFVKAK